MVNSKDKRIKKLKRKRIWPSVIGLFLLLFIFVIIFAVMVAFSVADIARRKINQSFFTSYNVAKMYENYSDGINDDVKAYIELTKEVEAIAVFDSQGNKKSISNGEYPNIENVMEIELPNGSELQKFKIIIDEDEEQLFRVKDNVIVVNNNIFEYININNIAVAEIMSMDTSAALTYEKIWVIVPIGDLQVAVLNNIYIYRSDFIALFAIAGMVAVLMFIFAIYYLISFISVFMNMRKTTRIIYMDFVTGGNNWLHFTRKGNSLLKKNKKGKFNYAVLHFQMRKYRNFCSCFGVARGEELIEAFYKIMKSKINSKEVLAHKENAQFGILLKYEDKQALINRVSSIEQALLTVSNNMKMYFSVGVYEVKPGEKDIEQAYNNAYISCEMLTEEAGNQIVFFDEEMSKKQIWERKVENDMDRALQNKEFVVYLQPKISTKEEYLAGAEALVRWIHPEDGFIPPNKFIPIFEKNGFIIKLDDYMLEEIAIQQAKWISEGKKVVPISVNISRAHFTKENLAEHICTIVDKYNVPHNVIELELTESAFFDDKNVLLNTVGKLREAGFIVSMDDFGAGYSSLNSLKELKIDVLKIDADFFRGVEEQERGMLIVSEVIDLAKKLNMKIVAEGIENREQVDFLVEQECDLIQGYFFAKPMPISDFEEKYS